MEILRHTQISLPINTYSNVIPALSARRLPGTRQKVPSSLRASTVCLALTPSNYVRIARPSGVVSAFLRHKIPGLVR
jgi:hypothetical protein